MSAAWSRLTSSCPLDPRGGGAPRPLSKAPAFPLGQFRGPGLGLELPVAPVALTRALGAGLACDTRLLCLSSGVGGRAGRKQLFRPAPTPAGHRITL